MPGASALSKIDQSQKDRANVLKLSNGVELLIKRISPAIFIDIMTEADEGRPQPPVTYIERLGRDEANPDDPDYQERLRAFNVQRSKRMSDMFLIYGTRLYACPAGIESPDVDGEWLENARELQIDSKNTKRGRYLLWLKTVALEDADDYAKVMEEVGRKSGVRTADVEAAQESFRPENTGPASS